MGDQPHNQFVKILVSEVFLKIGFLCKKDPHSTPVYRNQNWLDVGLEYVNNGYEEISGKEFMIFKIVDKNKFLWNCVENGFKYEPYNVYK